VARPDAEGGVEEREQLVVRSREHGERLLAGGRDAVERQVG
jgi:hypothetical protein